MKNNTELLEEETVEIKEITIPLTAIMRAGANAYLLFLFVVLSLYHREGFVMIGDRKYRLFFVVSILMVPALLLLFLGKKYMTEKSERQEKMRALDICMLGYAGIVIVSALYSIDSSIALWGFVDWHMGVLSQLMFVGIYFAISRCWVWNRWMPKVLLLMAGVLSLLGVCNRFALDPLHMFQGLEYWNKTHLLATIGNINWYCGYLCATVPFLIGYFIFGRHRTWQSAVLLVLNMLAAAALMVQGSTSGLAALAALLILYLGLSLGNKERLQRFLQWNMGCGAAVILLGFWYTMADKEQIYFASDLGIEQLLLSPMWFCYAGIAAFLWGMIHMIHMEPRDNESEWRGRIHWLQSVIDGKSDRDVILLRKKYFLTVILVGLVGVVCMVLHGVYPAFLPILNQISICNWNDSWGSGRIYLWKVVVKAFTEMPFTRQLLGAGPDCFAPYIYTHYGNSLQGFLAEWWGDAEVASAHNEWLNALINTGILGMISYMSIFATALYTFYRKCRDGAESNWICLSIIGCLAAYCVNNSVSFQQVMSTPYIFALMGMGMAARGESEKIA
ncbi:MAG: O-antigen ligase family protein [Lachnospiraceae bacterium]|nr:O-antigen ligase family protein [Lachnospiraceae bacterium]